MVQIPTTQRQFHNTTTKANTLALYADALKPAVQNANKIFMQQQKIKIDTRATQARIEADDYVNNMRLQYQGNPDSPEFKQAISGGLHDIFERYGQDIDPMAKGDWNLTANKMTGAYDLSNNEWIIKQRADNAKVDIAEKMAIDFDLAYKHGSNGNVAAGKADLEDSYGKLFEYAKSNMGETEAKKLLKDYQRKYTLNYLNGLMNSNPAAAQQMLNDKKTQEVIGSERAVKTLKKISADSEIKQMKKYNQDKRIRQEYAWNMFKDKKDKTIADLEAYKDNFEPDMTDAKYDRALKMITERNEEADTNVGVDIETAKELQVLAKSKDVSSDDMESYLKNVSSFIDNVQAKNKEGKLSAQQMDNYMHLAMESVNNKDLKENIAYMPDFSTFNSIIFPDKNNSLSAQIEENYPLNLPKTDVVGFENEDELSKSFEELQNMASETKEERDAFIENVAQFSEKLYSTESSGVIDFEKSKKYQNDLWNLLKDKTFMNSLNKLPQEAAWKQILRNSIPYYNAKSQYDALSMKLDIDNVARNTMEEVMKAYSQGDFEGAEKAYKEGMEKAIRRKYAKWIPAGMKLEPGKTILNLWGIPCKFMGFGATDICVEVEE